MIFLTQLVRYLIDRENLFIAEVVLAFFSKRASCCVLPGSIFFCSTIACATIYVYERKRSVRRVLGILQVKLSICADHNGRTR